MSLPRAIADEVNPIHVPLKSPLTRAIHPIGLKPRRKDKTLVHILDSLTRLEKRFDDLGAVSHRTRGSELMDGVSNTTYTYSRQGSQSRQSQATDSHDLMAGSRSYHHTLQFRTRYCCGRMSMLALLYEAVTLPRTCSALKTWELHG